MRKLSAVISCWLVTVGAVMAQTAQAQTGERLLPQWLTGIIAVTGFLFLTFVGFLVKKAWCETSSRENTTESVREDESVMTNGNTYEISLDMVRSKEDINVYDNVMVENPEDKVTAM